MHNHDFIQKISSKWPSEKAKALSGETAATFAKQIKQLLKEKNAALIAHYYTDPLIQKLAEETGGFIGDSLEMARFGAETDAAILVIAGVRFMGETAKIISPGKKVIMPSLQAECSLDLGCEPVKFKEFCSNNPDRTVVVYANTSAEIKAMADWVVTSSIAVEVIDFLGSQGKKVIWAPDKFLGSYIQKKTNADMILWDACCVVHLEFCAEKIRRQKLADPSAKLLVHPESQPEVVEIADVVGSTSQLLAASRELAAQSFIVATESGILYKMQQASPHKSFTMAATRPDNDIFSCEQNCPWMKMNDLTNLYQALLDEKNEISVPEKIREKAMVPLNRMLEFKNMKR